MTKYERTGTCNRCGNCCRFPITKMKIKEDEAIHKDEIGDCEYLQRHKDGKTTCVIQDSKPYICQAYPRNQNELMQGCAFKFKKKRK